MARLYVVAPDGIGTEGTQDKPCLLNTAIRLAQAGDEIILKDGVYRQLVRFRRSGTFGNPIVLRAENPQQAAIELPDGVVEGKNGGKNSVITTTPYSHITVSGLMIDGRGMGESGIVADNGSNLVIENNHIRNTGSGGIGMKGTINSVIRLNIIEDTGKAFLGEGFYIGQASGESPVKDIEIYGNIVRRVCMNFIDMKRGNENVNVHHNIFEDLLPGRDRPDLNARSFSDGLVLMGLAGVRGSLFTDNIVRNVIWDKPAQLLKISQNSGHVVQYNIFCNINNKLAISGHQTGSLGPSTIIYNTFSALESYEVSDTAGPLDGVSVFDNKVDEPKLGYDIDEYRLMKEIVGLGVRYQPAISE